MYSDNYRGGYAPRGRPPYRGRGDYDNSRYHDDRFYEASDPPYNAIQEYQPRPVYSGPPRGNYYQGGGGRRPYNPYPYRGGGGFYRSRPDSSGFYRNDRGRYNRNYYQPRGRVDYQYNPNFRGPRGGRRPNNFRRPYYPPRDPQDGRDPRDQRWQRNEQPPPYENPPNTFRLERTEELPEGLSWCCDLDAHSSHVNCLAFDEDAGKLFSGGGDGTVRQWNAETGQIEHSASYSGEITALLVETGYLFVAVHCTQDEAGNQAVHSGDIHIYNLGAHSEQKFMAHIGRVLALHTTADVFFSAGEDRIIKGWKFNAETKLFAAAGSFDSNSAHSGPIQCITTLSIFLFSGDANGAIVVWNMTDGSQLQTLHGHSAAVSSMLCWKGTLITGSMDRTISVWNLDLAQNTRNVVQTPPLFHCEARNAGGYPSEVIGLHGTPDGANSPVLMAALATNEVALYNLPRFDLRGILKNAPYPRGLSAAAGNCLFLGLANGAVRIYVWDENQSDEAAMVM